MSEKNNIVIIGCGAGGGTAAQFARKTNRDANITIIEKGKYPQYSKCGLPYVISGEIPSFENLIEFSEDWFAKEKIELRLNTSAEGIDVQNKKIIYKNKEGEFEQIYDKLILATGANSSIPPIKNIFENNKLINGIYSLRNIDDGKKILKFANKGVKVVVVGAGLIGLELADVLYKKGLNVTIVEALPNILQNSLDQDMINFIEDNIKEKIRLFTNHLVTRVEANNSNLKKVAILNNNSKEEISIDTDLLIVAAGTKSNVHLAKKIRCEIGKTGAIVVNNKCETSIKDVYAVGDCTEYKDFITNEPICAGLGSIAVRQGIAAGTNAGGGDYKLSDGFLLSRTSRIFDIEIAATGPLLTNLDEYKTIIGKVKGLSLPNYYPGGEPINLKIFADGKNGRILAAQAVGKNSALRINTIACAILNKSNVDAFRKLETTYAPPIAPTLDVITLACDVISLKMARKKIK